MQIRLRKFLRSLCLGRGDIGPVAIGLSAPHNISVCRREGIASGVTTEAPEVDAVAEDLGQTEGLAYLGMGGAAANDLT